MASTNTPKSHALLPLGHEALYAVLDGFDDEVRRFARAARTSPSFGEGATVPGPRVVEIEGVTSYVNELASRASDNAQQWAAAFELVAHHLHYALNFELHRRKVFWVDDSLAWMLMHTNLDIEGRALKLPFPCFAFVFKDEATLEMMQALVGDARQPFRILTAYVTAAEGAGGVTELSVAFVADARDGELPHLSTRVLSIKPDDDLATILDSHPSWVNVDAAVAEQHATALKRLVHLVINAVLYSTSAAPDAWQLMSSPVKAIEAKARGLGEKRQRRAATRAAGMRKAHSSESVFFLPGKIPISHLRALRDLERQQTGGELFSRFMVRGHWRRPGTKWSDQQLRWIEPYWKGPDMAAIVEREYRMTT